MALGIGGVSPYGAVAGLIVQTGNEPGGFDEALSLDDDGHILNGDHHTYNDRLEPAGEYEVPVSAALSAVDVDVDLGAELNSRWLAGVVLTQRNTAYPRISLSGTKYDNGSIIPAKYTLSMTGLYFGCHFVLSLTGHTDTHLQNVTLNASLANIPEARDNDGNHLESQGTVVRLEESGTILNNGAAPTLAAGWKGKVGEQTANNGYKMYSWNAIKMVDTAV